MLIMLALRVWRAVFETNRLRRALFFLVAAGGTHRKRFLSPDRLWTGSRRNLSEFAFRGY